MQNKPLFNFFDNFETISPVRSLKSLNKNIQGLIEGKLWLRVLIGLMLGIALGILLGPDADIIPAETGRVLVNWLALPGQVFLRLVKMIIIPLVFSSIIIGLVSSGDPEFLKKIGPRMILYFTATTAMAIIIGFGMAFLIKPGSYVDSSQISITQDLPVESDYSTPIEQEFLLLLNRNWIFLRGS